ncbi:ABC transporter ATP-binding protein [uncultured Megamonas sp.]|uniref:ABC transporter ATP-binding protein n=1 Tax=uncultured Megamonas sp. TaxID=286140 RepID=UPI00259243AB|nr:ABC transporter ATP-binding protein [uncultured Megamonas sp.]
MIKISNVDKYFNDVKIIDDCNLVIKSGELTIIAGGDGAGKTSLIKLIVGLLNPDRGYILIDRKIPYKKRADIGYMAQNFSWYRNLTVEENVILSAKMHGFDSKQALINCNEMLNFVGLDRFKHHLAEKLSGGMKQKLALAATLVYRPQIILLDEPTTGVDPVSRQELWDLIQTINKEDITIIVATPYFDEVMYAKHIIYMNKGKIILDDKLEILQQKYNKQNLADVFISLIDE